jgi:hypothetical protein|tara:strand:+ start:78 stop:371 length:294 start_codon:yes stop_codon:yes gene_type:complete
LPNGKREPEAGSQAIVPDAPLESASNSTSTGPPSVDDISMEAGQTDAVGAAWTGEGDVADRPLPQLLAHNVVVSESAPYLTHRDSIALLAYSPIALR